MKMFYTMDWALTYYIAITSPRLQKHDYRLEMAKEKIEVMEAWFNELRINIVSSSHGSKIPNMPQQMQQR